MGCVLDESGTDEVECSRKVASGRKVTGVIRSLVNARDLQIELPRVLHETLLVTVLMFDSETMLWKGKEKSRVRAIPIWTPSEVCYVLGGGIESEIHG